MEILHSLFGIAVFLGFAWLLSENRKQISPRILIAGLLLQFILALLLLKVPAFKEIFVVLQSVVGALETATRAGTSFVFGYLGGGPLPFEEKSPGSSFILAFQALPILLVMSALSALLFYLKVLPFIVRLFSSALRKTMGISGITGLGTAANIFMGMVESPLLIRPYLASATRSELFIIMTGGMATIAGTVMVLYASILGPVIPDALGHILTASVLNAPAAIIIASLLVPETQKEQVRELVLKHESGSAMDAITKGTMDGISLFLNIIAMLIVLVALVQLVNLGLGLLPDVADAPITLERIMGLLMAPVVWLMGIPWSEAQTAGSLMGTKVILNELLAYLQMAHLPEGSLSEHSRLILTYAMCGFANFGSLGIMIGGMGTMAPERKAEIVNLGLKSILAGVLATCLTATLVAPFI